ncbi:hypothetical protein A2Z22_00615 [Candidatus Woesebacteria bacterium RBG_16_34_12]|uniref:Glycosyltransferase subfamily 4-like N-terminal domain-containing protein n=1 Tax=Candidatus Woesebacteria bacterium RBG_16_34_12 TaxID=1802480 RepID=A0A1F7XA39_9BACT|nr:MAG: hypothetical protein A2Z22_00615 [Candidatus Woesebacteria bacterium RBG_16_34_12]
MKILLGISYYSPNISGLTIYAKNLAEELVKKGYDVEVLTSRQQKDLSTRENLNGVLVKRVWTPFIFGRGPIMPTYPLDAYFAVRKADIINCHIPSFEAIFICFWAKLFRKKIVLTHHCDLSNWPGLINQITEKLAYASLLVQGLLADKIVVYTKDYADYSGYLQRFKSKLIFCLPPVKVEKLDGKYKSKFKYKNVKYKIGFAGRIAKEKGIEYLLNAIPLIEKDFGNNFKIFIAGPGKEVVGGGYIKELNDLIKKYKKYLIFLGPLNPKQMAGFYKLIDVLVLPSTEKIESFGFVQVEAMLLGCPVIASDLPGVRMPIKISGMGKTVPIKNSNALADSIIEVIKGKDKFVKPKKVIERVFNFEKSTNTYEELYKNVS